MQDARVSRRTGGAPPQSTAEVVLKEGDWVMSGPLLKETVKCVGRGCEIGYLQWRIASVDGFACNEACHASAVKRQGGTPSPIGLAMLRLMTTH